VRAGRLPESVCVCRCGQVRGSDDGPIPGEFGVGLDDEADSPPGDGRLGQEHAECIDEVARWLVAGAVAA
jgi:hypothetical protein